LKENKLKEIEILERSIEKEREMYQREKSLFLAHSSC
jgi:hypothetical protein